VVNLSDSLTDLTVLVATFTTTGASVSVGPTVQVSGTTPNDFTDPVIYTVKGADNSTANYSVIVQKPATWVAYDWITVVEPPTGWNELNSMNSFCTIDSGILSFNSGAVANQAHYRYYFADPFPLGSKMTIIFKARADSTAGTLAWVLDFQNGYRGQLEIRNGRATLINGTATMGTIILSSSAWHTYFLSYEVVTTGLQMKVYVDGAARAALSGIATFPTTSGYIRLGDLSGNNSYKGSLDWIMWTFNGAYAPGIGLPSGFSLVP